MDRIQNELTSLSMVLKLKSVPCALASQRASVDQPRPLSRELVVTVASQTPPRAAASDSLGVGGARQLGISGPPGDFYIRSGLGVPALGTYATELLCKMNPPAVEASEQEG